MAFNPGRERLSTRNMTRPLRRRNTTVRAARAAIAGLGIIAATHSQHGAEAGSVDLMELLGETTTTTTTTSSNTAQSRQDNAGSSSTFTFGSSGGSSYSSSLPMPLSEQEILTTFYRSTNGPDWYANSNWLQGDNVCSWYGVTCHEQWGEVIQLELPSNHLVGYLPPELFQLPKLHTINVNGNPQLGVADPNSSSTATSATLRSPIETLKLGDCSIANSLSFTLKTFQFLSSTLRRITLSDNDFGGAMIPSQLFELTSLEALNIANCNLSGNLLDALGNLVNLQVLNAADNSFNGVLPATALGKMTSLIELNLSGNIFVGPVPGTELSQLKYLERLSIAGRQEESSTTTTTGSSSVAVQQARSGASSTTVQHGLSGNLPNFAGLPRLHTIDLSYNQLEGTFPESFLPDLMDNRVKLEMSLQHNHLSGAVPESLSKFDSIVLKVTGNKFRSISPALCSKTSWMKGDVAQFGCDGIACPRNTYSPLGRKAQGSGTCLKCSSDSIAPYVGSHKCLAMTSNAAKLSWKEHTILMDLFDATRGETWYNHTHWGDNSKNICTWHGISCLHNGTEVAAEHGIITAITLSNNHLNGTIPAVVFDLQALESLDVSKNGVDVKLAGMGDSGAARLKALRFDDTLTSSLKGIAKLTKLQILRATNAQLSGTIPEGMFTLQHLHTLDLGKNQFNGTLSSTLGHLLKLQSLNLQDNALVGRIPDEIGGLSNLVSLNLAENNWNGTFPSAIGESLLNLKDLDISDFSDEAGEGLTGPIPNFTNHLHLHSLKLGGNSLTGTVPKMLLQNLQNKTHKVEVDLRWNQLSGRLRGGLLQGFPKVDLFVTGNHFVGEVPSQLCSSDRVGWMEGLVGIHGCDAILCPAGTYNSIGRQIQSLDPCRPCPDDGNHEAPYLGTVMGCTFLTPVLKQKRHEHDILASAYRQMNGENWLQKDNWLQSHVDICEWHGITCADSYAGSGGVVTKIDLRNNNLVGSNPSSLFDLPALQSLDLSGNVVEFEFDGIGRATALTELTLKSTSTNHIKNLGQATNLTSLILDQSPLKKRNYLAEEIVTLQKLRHLHLSGCGLEGRLSDQVVRALTKLEHLDLSKNKLRGTIPESVGELRNLKTLKLSENRFTGIVPAAITSLSQLEVLHLERSGSETDGVGLSGPLPDLSSLTSLQQVYLSSNSFSGTIPSTLLQGVTNTTHTIRVDLRWNQLRGTVPATLNRFDNMELYLVGNYIEAVDTSLCVSPKWMEGAVSSYGCDALLCPTNHYSLLGRQALPSVPCTPCAADQIAPYMGSTKCIAQESFQGLERAALTRLYQATNGPQWTVQTNWLDAFDVCLWYGVRCSGNNVIGVDLEGNKLSGAVPAELVKLPSLQELNLGQNLITLDFKEMKSDKLRRLALHSTLLQEMDGLKNFPNLEILHLQHNNIASELPKDVFDLSKLIALHLQDNHIWGTLSSKIKDLKELESFDLSQNRLQGPLPDDLGTLKDLRIVNLSQNSLSGNLPSTLTQLTNVEELNLSAQTKWGGLGFSGPLLAFESSPALTTLELEGNSLTGTIPRILLGSVAVTDSNVIINLSNNQLSGDLPMELSRFDSLTLGVVGNLFQRLPLTFCEKPQWMNGDLGQFGCEAITCPAGTYSSLGRRTVNLDCKSCNTGSINANYSPSSPYIGSKECSSDRRQTEQLVLERLYQAAGGSNWHNRDNWMVDSSNICTWYGITCNEDGFITDIALGGNNLKGTVPSDVFHLPWLTRLSLYSNPVSISLNDIANASRLHVLELDSTGLQSLDGIGQARGLTELSARFNGLQGILPTEISALSNLEYLTLADNNFSGTLPSYLNALSNMRQLKLGSNQLSGSLLDFATTPALNYLDLSDNRLTGMLPAAFLKSCSPTARLYVDLSSNGIQGVLPASLGYFADLNIHLRDNQIEAVHTDLCQEYGWMNGEVRYHGCYAILCPVGTYNEIGRQSDADQVCQPCDKAMFMGSTSCGGNGRSGGRPSSSGSMSSWVAGATLGSLAGVLLLMMSLL
jgi:Leucine-rich repeat (LRR) protein